MAGSLFKPVPLPYTSDMKWRFRFSIATLVATVALIAWGAFVTSISAGLAVPDWPTSFGSWNQLNPWPEWWNLRPVVAEHGHRLAGAVVGFLTLVLAVWTVLREPRKSVRLLAVAALALVIFQGVLGGLRVIWVSLDLAVVHACVAQIFFATLVALIVFTSRTWVEARDTPLAGPDARKLPLLAGATVGMLYVQIILGALLRHPGEGIDFSLAMLHIGGGIVSSMLIIGTFVFVRRRYAAGHVLRRVSRTVLQILFVQVTLGFIAYFVLLDSGGRIQPSNFQVIVNSSHVVFGAFLFGSAVGLLLYAVRRAASMPGKERGVHLAPSDVTSAAV